MIRHLEIRLLAHGLHLGNELADVALLNELIGQGGFEHHREIPFGNGGEPFALDGIHEHVLRAEAYLRALELELEGLALRVRGDAGVAHAGGVLEVVVDLGQELAVPRPEELELRLYAVGDEGGGVLHVLDALDVQLAFDYLVIHFGKRLRALHVKAGKRLAVLNVGLRPCGPAQHDYAIDLAHILFELGIYEGGVRNGIIAEVHAFGSLLIAGADEVLIHLLRHEGGEGSRQQRHRLQNGVKGHVGGFLICRHLLAPVALAAAADVPVGKIVRKGGKLTPRLGYAEGGEVFILLGDEGIELGEYPLIHYGKVFAPELMLRGIELVYIGIEDVERVGVPQGAHVLALGLGNGLAREAAGQPGGGGGVEIPPDGVRTLLGQYVRGGDHVAYVLGHLLAVLIADEPQHYAVLEGGLVKQAGRDGVQGVEPAARLIDGLADVIGGIALFEFFLVFKGIMPLRKGHGAGIEPAVYYNGLAAHDAAALGAGHGEGIEHRLMQLYIGRRVGEELQKLLAGTHGMVMPAFFALPYGQRSAPVALPRYRPVYYVLKEIAHAAFAYGLGDPVDALVEIEQLIAQLRHFDEPAAAREVYERSIAAPAEGVAVLVGELLKEPAAFLEIGYYELIRLLDVHAVPGGASGELALRVHVLNEGEAPVFAYSAVVNAECGSKMNDARAVGQRNVTVGDHAPALLAAVIYGEVEEGLVFHAAELRALVLLDRLAALAQDGLDERLRHYVALAVLFDLDVILVRVHAEAHVRGEGPGGGRPGDELSAVVHALHGEGDEYGGLLDVLIALRHLMGGERRPAAGAVGDYLVALVEEALFVDGLQRPPHGLDIVVRIGDVGVFHIRPIADRVGHLLPLALVLPDGLLALGDEGLDPVLLYLLLAVKAQQLFDLQLDGQTVGIPARLAKHVVALHGAVAGDNVLHGSCQHVPDVGLAVSRGGTVEEGVGLAAAAELNGLLEYFVFLPEFQNLLLAGDEIHGSRDFLIHIAFLSLCKDLVS